MVHQKDPENHQTTKLIGNIESRVLQSSDGEETEGSMLAQVLAQANAKKDNDIELKSVEGNVRKFSSLLFFYYNNYIIYIIFMILSKLLFKNLCHYDRLRGNS